MIGLAECFAINQATEWFIAGVGSLIENNSSDSSPMVRKNEDLSFLISVDSLMDLQMIGLAECFSTQQAAELFIAGVDSNYVMLFVFKLPDVWNALSHFEHLNGLSHYEFVHVSLNHSMLSICNHTGSS